MEDFLVDLDDWGFLLLGGFGSRHGMALLSEVRLRTKTLTDWRAICIFKKCERFFTLPIIAKGAVYVLVVKDISRSPARLSAFSWIISLTLPHPCGAARKNEHGRLEVRNCWQSENVKWIPAFRE